MNLIFYRKHSAVKSVELFLLTPCVSIRVDLRSVSETSITNRKTNQTFLDNTPSRLRHSEVMRLNQVSLGDLFKWSVGTSVDGNDVQNRFFLKSPKYINFRTFF